MRAIVVDRYGPPEVARLREVPTPEPRKGEVLVRVHASAVTSGDARMRSGVYPPGFGPVARMAIGFRGPRVRVLGVVFSGEVESVGPGVVGVSVGDRVSGLTGARCGAHAELVRVAATKAVPTPDALTHDAAAAVLFGGSTAIDFLDGKDPGLEPGMSVLINGASGAVGSAAVQFAHHVGAHVTAVCSADSAEFVAGLGADRIVDYRTTSVHALAASGERFDRVLDTVGNLSKADRGLLAADGILLLAVASLGQTIFSRGAVRARVASENPALLARVLQLAADGILDPLIERSYDLADIAAAYARVDSGHKRGNLVLNPQS